MQKIVTKFYFQNAKYLVGDDNGNEVFLKIDYKNSYYAINPVTKTATIKTFMDQVKIVAQKLIIKKHGVNFSDRIEI